MLTTSRIAVAFQMWKLIHNENLSHKEMCRKKLIIYNAYTAERKIHFSTLHAKKLICISTVIINHYALTQQSHIQDTLSYPKRVWEVNLNKNINLFV